MIAATTTIEQLTGTPDLTSYDWIVVSSSAGKDSQAMLDKVCKLARDADVLDRVVVVHADLGRVEWRGCVELAAEQAAHYGVRFEVVERDDRGDLLDEIESRRMFPSAGAQFCTSYYKREPIAKLYTRLANETHGNDRESKARPSKVSRRVRVLECLGLRAEESPKRNNKPEFTNNKRATNASRRLVDTWLPIHQASTADVWRTIKLSGVRHHEAYDLGMPRLSCAFCVFAPRAALLIAAEHNRDTLNAYCDVETKIGHTFKADLSIVELRDAYDAGERGDPNACSGGCWGDSGI